MRHVLATILIPLAACSAPRGTQHLGLEPIHSLETLDMAYNGALSAEGLPKGQYIPAAELDPGRMIDLRVKMYEVDEDALPAIMSEGKVWLRADRVERAAAEQVLRALIDDGRAAGVINPRIQFQRGSTSNLSVANSVTYLKSFSLAPFGSSAMGDPQIGTCLDGFLAEVSAPEEGPGDRCEIHLKLSMAELQRPIAQTETRIPGNGELLSIETPIFATQEIELDVVLQPQESVVIGPLPGFRGGRPLVVLVTAVPVDLPDPELLFAGEKFELWKGLLTD